jgi:quinol monooxygenase YgiN
LKRFLSAALGLLITAFCLAGCANQETGAASAQAAPVTVVAHLDIARTGLDNALLHLRSYIAASQHEPGAVRIELLRQVTSNNHFTLIEIWSDQNAYETHVAAQSARDFHNLLDPILGSPHDERLFVNVAGN